MGAAGERGRCCRIWREGGAGFGTGLSGERDASHGRELFDGPAYPSFEPQPIRGGIRQECSEGMISPSSSIEISRWISSVLKPRAMGRATPAGPPRRRAR